MVHKKRTTCVGRKKKMNKSEENHNPWVMSEAKIGILALMVDCIQEPEDWERGWYVFLAAIKVRQSVHLVAYDWQCVMAGDACI